MLSALVLGWVFDLTPEGFVKTDSQNTDPDYAEKKGRLMDIRYSAGPHRRGRHHAVLAIEKFIALTGPHAVLIFEDDPSLEAVITHPRFIKFRADYPAIKSAL